MRTAGARETGRTVGTPIARRGGVARRRGIAGPVCVPMDAPGRVDTAGRSDAGTMALELAILTPLLIAFMMMMVGLGRIVESQSQVDGAAHDAARAASIARTPQGARVEADDAVAAVINGEKRWCQGGPRTNVDLSHWGRGGQVTVTVRCRADLGGLSLVGFSASKTLTGTATAPIDTLRRVVP